MKKAQEALEWSDWLENEALPPMKAQLEEHRLCLVDDDERIKFLLRQNQKLMQRVERLEQNKRKE